MRNELKEFWAALESEPAEFFEEDYGQELVYDLDGELLETREGPDQQDEEESKGIAEPGVSGGIAGGAAALACGVAYRQTV